MLPLTVRSGSEAAERRRLQYTRDKRRLSFEELTNLVVEKPDSGPHLVVVNTVQTAAELGRAVRNGRLDVLHLSTALTPNDREPIIKRIKQRLNEGAGRNWALIATSCVEAGLDFDFRTAFRELSSVTSVIQIGGRVNRSGNRRNAAVTVFSLDDARASQNPALKVSMKVLDRIFDSGDDSVRTEGGDFEVSGGEGSGAKFIEGDRFVISSY